MPAPNLSREEREDERALDEAEWVPANHGSQRERLRKGTRGRETEGRHNGKGARKGETEVDMDTVGLMFVARHIKSGTC